MTFYTFGQNNSGGSFDHDPHAGISHYVIVEADSAQAANYRARDIGIYFDGVDNGSDCECCGDRWYAQWNDESGDSEPSIYGQPVEQYDSIRWIDGPEAYVHYADGRIEPALTGK